MATKGSDTHDKDGVTVAVTVEDSSSGDKKVFVPPTIKGATSDGEVAFDNLEEMWKSELSQVAPDGTSKWYKEASNYWDGVKPTVDGVLGGFGHISKPDITGSKEFLKSLIKNHGLIHPTVAVDCGAGIGRITKDFLLHNFETVDLVESNKTFLDKAIQDTKDKNPNGKYLCVGLQDFVPEPARYDVIWVQWVANYLHDDDMISFLNRCSKGLTKTGVIIFKENTTKSDVFVLDKEDSSVTRSQEHFEYLFKHCELSMLKTTLQKGFPKGLFPVRMWALRPNRK